MLCTCACACLFACACACVHACCMVFIVSVHVATLQRLFRLGNQRNLPLPRNQAYWAILELYKASHTRISALSSHLTHSPFNLNKDKPNWPHHAHLQGSMHFTKAKRLKMHHISPVQTYLPPMFSFPPLLNNPRTIMLRNLLLSHQILLTKTIKRNWIGPARVRSKKNCKSSHFKPHL